MANTTLVVAERRDLERCEQTIAKGMATFVEVGQALARIRDGRLYRDTHKTFADYVQQRWSKSRRWADLTIESAAVTQRVENENNCSQKPANEAQARALAQAPEEEQAEVWAEVVEEHGDDVTAAQVAEAVKRRADAPAAPDVIDEALADDWWPQACRSLARIAKEFAERSERPILRPHLDACVGRVVRELKSLRSTIRTASPAERCPKCRGEGCPTCLHTGLLTYGGSKA